MQDLPKNFGLKRLRGALEKIPGRRIAVDIGAHKGIWTKVLMEEFDQVYSFEPIEDNFKVLQEINPYSYRVALGDHNGSCSFKSGENTGQYHIDGLDGEYRITTLDEFHFDEVDFIKIDVEGYENHTIIGSIETIERCKPAILLEDNGLTIRYGVTSKELEDTMENLGYEKVASFQDDDLWLYSQ